MYYWALVLLQLLYISSNFGDDGIQQCQLGVPQLPDPSDLQILQIDSCSDWWNFGKN